MNFEWNEAKNRVNVNKHGVDFADVQSAFELPMVTFLDQRRLYDEERWVGIGLLKTITVVIIFTEMDDQTIRIISARKATKREKAIYNEEIPD